MKIKLLLNVLVLLQFSIGFSQEECVFTKKQEQYYAKNPLAEKANEEMELRLLKTRASKFLEQNKVSASTVYEIPVVVHMMNDGTTPLKTDAEIINWIDNCNKFFDATYDTSGNWYTVARGGTVIPFKLVLAKRSPSCTATTGIIQINTKAAFPEYSAKGVNANNTDGIEDTQLRTLSRWDPQLYFNIYLVNTFDSVPVGDASGVQGYAGFPTNSDDTYDSFMKASVVTTTIPIALPHEFGHALGLYHPFRKGSETSCPTDTGDCTKDNDLVCDTPATKSLLGVSPLPRNSEINSCDAAGWNSVQYNMMNYTASTRLFTSGQKDRAIDVFLSNRESLTKSLGGTVPSASLPTVKTTTCIPPDVSSQTSNNSSGISLVEIGTIKNASEFNRDNKAYYDYTKQVCLTSAYSTNLLVSNNPQTIKIKGDSFGDNYTAWIDYNNDGNFVGSELIVANQTIADGVTSTFTFNIPTTGVVLDTPLRMRVIGDYGDARNKSCDTRVYGEVEDYSVTINTTVLGKNEFDLQSNLYIVPNPATNTINLSYDKIISEVKIINLAGQIVFDNKYNEKEVTISIGNFVPSAYLLLIVSEGKTMVEKIIKN